MNTNYTIGLEQRLAAMERELALTAQELANTYEELSAIHRFSDTLGTEIHTDSLSDKIAAEVSETLEVSTVAVMLCDETGDLVTSACRGNCPESSGEFRLKEGEGIPWHVVKTRKPLIVCDVSKHPAYIASPHTRTSIMAAPIMTKGKVLGIICVSDKNNNADFLPNELKLLSTIANQAAIAVENSRLYRNLEHLFMSIVRSFAAALDAKSAWTAGHSERVTTYAVAIAGALEADKAFLEEVRTCGLLHDVGKIGIPEALLDKTDRITAHEYETIRQHPIKGAQILEHIHSFGNIIPGIKYHHERWDGLGTPEGLSGDGIPMIARILAVADSYDAITSDRPYREKRKKHEAIDEIVRCSGTQFDPFVVKAFLNAVDQKVI